MCDYPDEIVQLCTFVRECMDKPSEIVQLCANHYIDSLFSCPNNPKGKFDSSLVALNHSA